MVKIRSGSNNRGTVSKANGESWAHNCPVTPFVVILNPTDQLVTYRYTKTASNITVYHDHLGPVNFEWTALYLE